MKPSEINLETKNNIETIRSSGKLVFPLLSLILLVVLTIFSAKFGFDKITSQRKELADLKKREETLRLKENLLRDVETQVLSDADTSVIAVPEVNPGLLISSQVRSAASIGNATISNLTISSPTEVEGSLLSRVRVTVNVEGVPYELLGFVKNISALAPVTTLDSLNFSEGDGDLISATAVLTGYFSPLPTKLPPVGDPAQDLSVSDKALIAKLSSLKRPVFITVNPQSPSGRSNPFSL